MIVGEGRNVSEFAKKCGFTEGALRSYLAGKSLPGLDKLVKIAEVAEVSIDWLAVGAWEMRREQPRDQQDSSTPEGLKSVPKPLVLIEEPEIHIHPKTAKKLSEVIAQLTEAQKKDVLKYAEERLVLASHRSECEGKKA